MTEAISYCLQDLDWEQVDQKLRRKVLDGRSMTLTRYSFAPGGRFPHHVHDQEQISFVLSGRLTFTIEGVEHDLPEGSMVFIPPSIPHSAEAGSAGAEVLSVVSPARTDGRGIAMLEGGVDDGHPDLP
jgi:Uncharacterized conserved protein, contains double-stranded beta-helix domain